MEQHHARRVGSAAVACALLIRLFSSGITEALADWLIQPNIAAFLIYLETGRDVRFSSSQEVFVPRFAESPPPAIPAPTEPPLPFFSDASSIELYNACGKHPDVDKLLAEPLDWNLRGEAPTVLILHTHTTESYTRQDEPYRESAAWRTLDEGYNMLSIGKRVAELLEQSGIPVIRDTDLHDYPSYNGSYTDARKSIRTVLKENKEIRLVLDLHRDASGDGRSQMRTMASVGGKNTAQLMLVMGTNFEGYEQNLSLALKLHALLEQRAPGIMRPLQLRASRFNQDLSPGALLIEVGAAGNTHQEALRAAEQLAQAIISLGGRASG